MSNTEVRPTQALVTARNAGAPITQYGLAAATLALAEEQRAANLIALAMGDCNPYFTNRERETVRDAVRVYLGWEPRD